MPPHAPITETERLKILRALDLLNDDVEPDFDSITHLGAKILGMPIIMSTLVDADCVWIKSGIGTELRQKPLKAALSPLVLAENGPLVITDTLNDRRLIHHPALITWPGLRFYAGTPIRSANGTGLGVLGILDTIPHELPASKLGLLVDLADVISNSIHQREIAAHAQQRLEAAHAGRIRAESRFHEVFECAGEGIALLGPDENLQHFNNSFCAIVGYTQEALQHKQLEEITHPADREMDHQLRNRIRSGEIDHYTREKRYVRKDGSSIWVQITVTSKKDIHGQVEYFIAIIKDIQSRKEADANLLALRNSLEEQVARRTQELTQINEQLQLSLCHQKNAEAVLRKREAELHMIIENANDAYVAIDSHGVISAWNIEAERILGWTAKEAIGSQLTDLIIPPTYREKHRQGLEHYLHTGESRVLNQRLELCAMHRQGREIPVEVRIRALHIEGNVLFSAFLNDISERKQREAEREREARYDALTGLLNRRSLFEILPRAIARVTRSKRSVALLFIDLDGFKPINDTFGHSVGDALLEEIATRLNLSIRQTDQAFRLGGDEFTVLLEDLAHGHGDALDIAETLLDAISQPYPLDDESTVQISASIGLSIHTPTDPPCSPDELITRADSAMYEAKRGGKAQVCVAQTSQNHATD